MSTYQHQCCARLLSFLHGMGYLATAAQANLKARTTRQQLIMIPVAHHSLWRAGNTWCALQLVKRLSCDASVALRCKGEGWTAMVLIGLDGTLHCSWAVHASASSRQNGAEGVVERSEIAFCGFGCKAAQLSCRTYFHKLHHWLQLTRNTSVICSCLACLFINTAMLPGGVCCWFPLRVLLSGVAGFTSAVTAVVSRRGKGFCYVRVCYSALLSYAATLLPCEYCKVCPALCLS